VGSCAGFVVISLRDKGVAAGAGSRRTAISEQKARLATDFDDCVHESPVFRTLMHTIIRQPVLSRAGWRGSAAGGIARIAVSRHKIRVRT
jgi:hypothetical protein